MVIEYEKLRHLVLEGLKSSSNDRFDLLLGTVKTLAMQKGFIINAQQQWYMPDTENVRRILHDLYIQGIIVFGKNEYDNNWPWFQLTEFGKKCLKENDIIPYDPEGYLKKLKEVIPNIDDVILLYVTESLKSFLKGCFIASTVMLGCASEKTFLLLMESFSKAFKDKAKQTTVDNHFQKAFTIKRKYDEFIKEFKKIEHYLPKMLMDDIDTSLNGIFALIRNCRNDAGHPTGKIIEREIAYANLILFTTYCKKAYDLMEYLKNNKL